MYSISHILRSTEFCSNLPVLSFVFQKTLKLTINRVIEEAKDS